MMNHMMQSCPFCGAVPTLEGRPCDYANSECTAWGYARCNKCRVKPFVSDNRSNGYTEVENGRYVFKRYRSNEEALDMAIAAAVAEWNRRAVSGIHPVESRLV